MEEIDFSLLQGKRGGPLYILISCSLRTSPLGALAGERGGGGGGGGGEKSLRLKIKKVKPKNCKTHLKEQQGLANSRLVRGHLWRPMSRQWGRGKVIFFAPIFPARLDFPSPLLSAPWFPRMVRGRQHGRFRVQFRVMTSFLLLSTPFLLFPASGLSVEVLLAVTNVNKDLYL